VESARAEAALMGQLESMPPPLELCDRPTIEAALVLPYAGYGGVERYPGLADKVAALTYALSKSQACPDGNKRVALILVMEFLDAHDADLTLSADEVADLILETAASAAAEWEQVIENLAQRYEPVIVPIREEEQ
jgi:prophage maintenance system killer protein